MIYWEVLPSMIDMGPINMWDMFNMLCTSTDILFKASRKTFEFIQEDFNEKICLADEKSEEVKVRKEKNDKQKLERQGYPVTAY